MKVVLIICVLMSACSDSAQGRFESYGEEAQIYCYSGGQQIFKGISTGRVSISQSGYIKFKEKEFENEKYIEIRADCIIKYND